MPLARPLAPSNATMADFAFIARRRCGKAASVDVDLSIVGVILSKIVIGRQFRGPPNSGNGGYVCGVLAGDLPGPVTSM